MPTRSVQFRRTQSQLKLGELLAEAEALEAKGERFQIEGAEAPVERGLTWQLMVSSLIAMQSTFQFGYNTGVINAPKDVVFPGHSDLAWSVVVSIFCIGGLIGAYTGGGLANALGRKGALIAAACLFMISGLLMALSQGIVSLCIARFLVGIAAGASTVFVPIYIGEIAPPSEFCRFLSIRSKCTLAKSIFFRHFLIRLKGPPRSSFSVPPSTGHLSCRLARLSSSQFMGVEVPVWIYLCACSAADPLDGPPPRKPEAAADARTKRKGSGDAQSIEGIG